jgi:hypothetical protein
MLFFASKDEDATRFAAGLICDSAFEPQSFFGSWVRVWVIGTSCWATLRGVVAPAAPVPDVPLA